MTQSRSTNKVLVFIIFLLLLTNILVLGYFLFFCKKKPEKKGKDSFASVLQREVGFTNEQAARFNELKKSHWDSAKNKMDKIIAVKNTIFDLSKQKNTQDSVVESLADSIGRLQKQVEIHAFRHVVETRKICTPEQEPAYDSLMIKIINKGRIRKQAGNPPADK